MCDTARLVFTLYLNTLKLFWTVGDFLQSFNTYDIFYIEFMRSYETQLIQIS